MHLTFYHILQPVFMDLSLCLSIGFPVMIRLAVHQTYLLFLKAPQSLIQAVFQGNSDFNCALNIWRVVLTFCALTEGGKTDLI